MALQNFNFNGHDHAAQRFALNCDFLEIRFFGGGGGLACASGNRFRFFTAPRSGLVKLLNEISRAAANGLQDCFAKKKSLDCLFVLFEKRARALLASPIVIDKSRAH